VSRALPALAIAALAAGLALAHACTSPSAVLELPPIFDCEVARLGADGDLCSLPEPCVWSEPAAGGCCTTRASCPGGRLALDTGCGSECGPCNGDDDCAFGRGFCHTGRCTPCPGAGPCAPCPPGWVPLQRNGCPSCECAPPSQCDILEPSTCPPPNRCYIGTRCSEACTSFDCCVNVCSNAECIPVAPEGCAAPCRVTAGCSACALEECQCLPGGVWGCRERCVAPGFGGGCRFGVEQVVILP